MQEQNSEKVPLHGFVGNKTEKVLKKSTDCSKIVVAINNCKETDL